MSAAEESVPRLGGGYRGPRLSIHPTPHTTGETGIFGRGDRGQGPGSASLTQTKSTRTIPAGVRNPKEREGGNTNQSCNIHRLIGEVPTKKRWSRSCRDSIKISESRKTTCVHDTTKRKTLTNRSPPKQSLQTCGVETRQKREEASPHNEKKKSRPIFVNEKGAGV